jgi:hypothetical protein
MMKAYSFGVMVMANLTQSFVSALWACHLKLNTPNGMLVMN